MPPTKPQTAEPASSDLPRGREDPNRVLKTIRGCMDAPHSDARNLLKRKAPMTIARADENPAPDKENDSRLLNLPRKPLPPKAGKRPYEGLSNLKLLLEVVNKLEPTHTPRTVWQAAQ